jgi:hypothetical protein
MTNKKFETAMMVIVKKLIPALNLQSHTIELEQVPESREGSAGYMECNFNYPYLNGKIFYSKRAVSDWGKGKDMTPFVLHELCHLITDPLYAKACSRYTGKADLEDERERLTDSICNIVLKNL